MRSYNDACDYLEARAALVHASVEAVAFSVARLRVTGEHGNDARSQQESRDNKRGVFHDRITAH